MSEFVTRERLVRVADVIAAPAAAAPDAAPRQAIDRSFELPSGLYAATVGLYLVYVGVMTAAFGNPSLALPLIVIAFFIVAAFAVPAMWFRMGPQNLQKPLTFAALRNRGIQTATGPLDAGAAAVQVLVLPVLILFGGVAIAIIAALT